MMTRFLAVLMMTLTTGLALAGEKPARAIVEQAAGCWTTPEAMRGIRFSAGAWISFLQDGNVSAVEITSVDPQTETARALAGDFAAAVKRCGPYVTDGAGRMNLVLAWPL